MSFIVAMVVFSLPLASYASSDTLFMKERDRVIEGFSSMFCSTLNFCPSLGYSYYRGGFYLCFCPYARIRLLCLLSSACYIGIEGLGVFLLYWSSLGLRQALYVLMLEWSFFSDPTSLSSFNSALNL